MNKKILFSALTVAALATTMTSCNKSNQNADEQTTKQSNPTELKIAYVEYDSIRSQYQFCKDYEKILNDKQARLSEDLKGKQQKVQAAVDNYQQRYNQNQFSSQEEAQRIQANIQRQGTVLQQDEQRYSQMLQDEFNKYGLAVHDSIQHFLAKYNKDKKFTLILSKQGDNLLYADKAIDITKQVIDGLNKAYKKPASFETTDKKK